MAVMAFDIDNGDVIVETRNLCYSYGYGETAVPALSDVSLSIKRGGVAAVLGGNGAGKSTLFLNLNGVLKPQKGEIFFGGKRVAFDKKGVNELRKRVGIVFQDPNDQLFSENVRNDIAFGALNMGMGQAEAARTVEEAARFAGVYDLLERPTHALSFGQKKRAAIAGVLVMKPELLILDELTAGLDPAGVSEIMGLLRKIRADTGVTVIIATHDIDIVPLYCDYAFVLHKGGVVMEGTPAELFQNPGALRSYGLRTPRILHLMEILKKLDDIDVDPSAATISAARATIKGLLRNYE